MHRGRSGTRVRASAASRADVAERRKASQAESHDGRPPRPNRQVPSADDADAVFYYTICPCKNSVYHRYGFSLSLLFRQRARRPCFRLAAAGVSQGRHQDRNLHHATSVCRPSASVARDRSGTPLCFRLPSPASHVQTAPFSVCLVRCVQPCARGSPPAVSRS